MNAPVYGMTENLWIFGYGSLVWKVDFPYKSKLTGCIKGYVRRFWQGSEDHRGVPGNPGRVVTLVPAEDPEECVWGVAYEIAPEKKEDVISHLDFREKGGYEQVSVTFFPTTADAFQLNLYVGTKDNPYFLGPASLSDIAGQIYRSVGPSGKNVDYLLNLAEAMRTLVPGVKDKHLFDLETEVRKMCCLDRGHSL